MQKLSFKYVCSAGANRDFGQVGKYSESMKALLVLVCLWLQLTGTDVYRISHALTSIHLNLLHILKSD